MFTYECTKPPIATIFRVLDLLSFDSHVYLKSNYLFSSCKWSSVGLSQYVINGCYSIRKLCNEQELDHVKQTETDTSIIKSALKIRSDITKMKSPYNFPFVSEMEDFHHEKLPHTLMLLINNILSGSSEVSSATAFRRSHSIAADIIFSATCGRIKMAKHILLPSGIKSLTGNVEIIHLLNRLGHGIAYTQLLEIETAVAMQRQDSDNYVVPNNLNKYVFTTLAWDNIDKCEETLSGAGTTHRVNGIAIQKRLIGPVQQTLTETEFKKRQRTFVCRDLPLPVYISRERIGPKKCETVDINMAVIQSAPLLDVGK